MLDYNQVHVPSTKLLPSNKLNKRNKMQRIKHKETFKDKSSVLLSTSLTTISLSPSLYSYSSCKRLNSTNILFLKHQIKYFFLSNEGENKTHTVHIKNKWARKVKNKNKIKTQGKLQ